MARYFVQHKTLHHAPAYEQEFMTCALYKPNRSHTYTVAFKGSHKPKNRKGSKLINPLLQTDKRHKITFKATYPLEKNKDAYTQIQLLRLKPGEGKASYGAAIKQFLRYKTDDLEVKCWCTLYYTQNYASAIRLYVHSLRGGLNYPARYGGGLEIGIILRYRITKNLRISLEMTFDSGHQGANVKLKLAYKG